MKEMRRWLESDASPQVIDALLRAEAPGALDHATRERSRRRVAALGVVPAVGATLLFQQAALGAVLGSAVVAAIVVAPRLFSATDSAPRAPASLEPARRAVARGAEGPEKASAKAAPATVASVEKPPEGKADLASRPEPLTQPPADAPGEGAEAPDLVREARALEDVRRSIESDPAGALRTLAAHELEFRSGALALEREFLSIRALVQLGRITEAESRAKRLRARAPGSLYERRLERLLETTEK